MAAAICRYNISTPESSGEPIDRYNDPRLYGRMAVVPFEASCQWIRTIANPLHPKCNLIVECAVRGMKFFIGIFAIPITALPALLGRIVQMVHYHSMTEHAREQPQMIAAPVLRYNISLPPERFGAPIHRYNDPRLYGRTAVAPFNASCQWIRTVTNPLHPKCNLIVECAVRAMKILTGTFAIAITALPALLGRIVQMAHYHSMTEYAREQPRAISVGGMTLPEVYPHRVPLFQRYYYVATRDTAIDILRWGFNPSKIEPETPLGEAVCVFDPPNILSYESDQLLLDLDLKQDDNNIGYDVGYVSDDDLWELIEPNRSSDKKVMATIRELFYQNGYRAIYSTQGSIDKRIWAIYDPSCISITKILSPKDIPLVGLSCSCGK